MLSCAHEQKAHGGAVDRRGQQNTALRHSWTLSNDSKYNEASFTMISTDSLRLRVAHSRIRRSRDLAIFVLTIDRQTDRQTNRLIYGTPCRACARGVIKHTCTNFYIKNLLINSISIPPQSTTFMLVEDLHSQWIFGHAIALVYCCMLQPPSILITSY